MSLFKNESPVLSRQASVASTVPNQSGAGNEPSSFNLIPLEHLITVPYNSGSVNGAVFVADDFYQVAAVREVHSTVSTSGTIQIEKLTGTQAPAGGTALLQSTISGAATINTVQSGTLVTTTSSLQLNPGDRLGLVLGGTLGTPVGNITIALKRWQ